MSNSASLALWLIPLGVILVLGILILLSRYWREKTEKELKALRLVLRQAQNERRELERRAQSYSGRDPEPYRSASSGLREQLGSIRRKLEATERRYIELNERSASLRFNRWRTLLGAPYLWQFLGRDALQVHRSLNQIQVELSQAAALEADIERLPWETALEARRLHDQSLQASQALAQLREQGLQGVTFEDASRSERQLQATLAQIDAVFLEGGELELLQQATKEDVALVYQVVQASRPRLGELLEQTRRWQTGFDSTELEVRLMHESLEELVQTLESLPPALDVSEERAALRRMEEISRNLQSATERMEVESIPLVGEEAMRLRQSAHASGQQIKQARRELASFEALLGELAADFRDLSLQLAELSARPLHPVEWDVSLEQLAQLNRQANALGNARMERTPLKVAEDFKTAAGLRAHQKELARHITEIQSIHNDLTALLESPEFRGMPKWIRTSQTLAEQAVEYASENWSSSANVPALAGEISVLASEIDRLVTDDPVGPVSELRLADRLDQTRGLGERYRDLAARIDHVHQRLEEIQQSEEQAQEGLENLHKFLNQVRLISQSNPFLAGIALAEIERMQHSAAELEDSLDQTQRGSVEKKARQVTAMLERFEASTGRWLDQMNKENQAMHRDLERSLVELDSIARLEDGSVGEARRLVSAGLPESAPPAHPTGKPGLANSILEFKRRSSHWQECRAAQNALENVQPLAETYREAAYQRKQVLELAAEMDRALQKRAWPPVSTSLEGELQDLRNIEAEWESLRQRSGKAISLVAQYTSLSSRYQNLGERLRQSVDRRTQEMRLVEDLEEQIATQTEPWEALLTQHRENPIASREIRGLLADLDEEMETIEKSYLRGDLDYDGVVQQMRGLQRRVRFYQVALDDETALDASGRLIRRRQSERGGF